MEMPSKQPLTGARRPSAAPGVTTPVTIEPAGASFRDDCRRLWCPHQWNASCY